MSVTAIDLEPFRLGTDNDRRDVAKVVDEVYRTTGFLTVAGHGVPSAVRNEMLDTTAAFFDLPVSEKSRYEVANKTDNRGYAAEGTEALAYSLGDEAKSLGQAPTAPDLFEAFNAGRENVLDQDKAYYDQYRQFFAPNVWPQVPVSMRQVWINYQEAVRQVSDDLLHLFAIALDLEPSFFIDRTRRAIATTRAINYERRANAPAPEPGQVRMGAHTDYGVLTVLLADNVPGLQVRHNQAWIDVEVPDESFVVNIGDMIATWTNDRWVSTLHRVVPPPVSSDGPVRRRSVASFFEADPDAIVEPVPTCVSEDNPARYKPMTAGDYLLAKLMGPRELRKAKL